MKRSAFWSIRGLAFLISVSTSAEAEPEPTWVKLDAKGNVRSFYGIPVTLTRAGLKRLGFRIRIGYRWPEGNKETVYKVTAKNKVEVDVTFGANGKFYRAMTTSRNAVGPRGVGIGSRLSEVRAAWPSGRFGYGCEDGSTPTYVTNTNVLLDFDWKDLPARARQCEQLPDADIPDLRVKAIRIESMVIGR